MTLRVRGKVWRYPGIGGWHFLTISRATSRRIRALTKGQARGFGSLRVRARIGKTEWRTSIFPAKEGTFLLPVKGDVRKREGIIAGTMSTVRLTFP